MLMRFVRTKFIAILLGPAGTGFLAQLTIFFEALRVWGDLGSRRAVIKQIAEQRKAGRASEKYGQVIKTSYVLALIASVLTAGAVILMADRISASLYGDASHARFIVFSALLLPVASISTITASIVKGNLDYTPFAKYTLASYVAVILATPLFIYFFHYWGAVIVQGLFFLFPLVGYLVFNARKRFLHFSGRISGGLLREQFSYGSQQIYQDSLINFSRLLAAAWIIKSLGLQEMGLYQVVITFSTVYMSIPIQSMTGYTFPLIAAAESHAEITKAINDSLRFLMFILVPVIVALMVWPEIFIVMFFSSEFLKAAPVLQVQLFSTLFLLMTFSYNSAISAKGKIKAMFWVATLQPVTFILLAWLLFPHWKLMGIASAYAVSMFFNYVAHCILTARFFGMKLYPKNLRLCAATALWVTAAFAAGCYSNDPWLRVLVAAGAVPWFLFSSKDHERKFLCDKTAFFLRPQPLKS